MKSGIASTAAAAVLFGASSVFWYPVHAHAETELTPTAENTFAEIRSCLSQEGASLNTLFLLDASSSLPQNTDPGNLRSQILAQALDQLGSVAENRQVNWSVVKFDLGAQVMKPWELLTPENVETATSWAQSQDGWWGQGQGTDWLSGLQSADEYMRTAPPSDISCNMTIWLTDGGINVDGGRDPDVNAQAIEQICGRSPITGEASNTSSVINSIRSSNTHLIGVLLKSDEFLTTTDPQTRAREESSLSFMMPITEGSGMVDNGAFAEGEASSFEFACGDTGPGFASGALLLGTSPISLAYSFADLANGIVGGQAQDLGDDFPVSFSIDPGINYVSVQLAGADWELLAPDGSILAERGQTGGAGVRVSQRGELASIQVTGDRVSEGLWTLNVEEPLAGARLYTDVRLQGEFIQPELQVAEESLLGVDFLDSYSREPVPADLFEASPLKMTVQQNGVSDQELSCRPDGSSLRFVCPFVPSTVGDVRIAASITVTTKSQNATTRWSGEYPDSIEPPANFPKVSPESVSLSPLDGRRGSAQGQITLVGPEIGDGQVCFPDPTEVQVVRDVVDRASGYVLTQAPWGECVAVSEAQQVEVAIAVANSTAASGFVELSLPVRLLSDESVNEQVQNVAIEFETIRQGSPPLWLVALLIFAGFGFPIALLYAQARAASRLSLSGLQQAVIPIEISTEGSRVSVRRQGGGELLQVSDWQYLPAGQTRPRSFSPAEGSRIVAVTPKNPVGPLRAEVKATSGYRVVTSQGGTTDGTSGMFGLMPAGQWFMSAKEADLASTSASFPGLLVAFANPTGGALAETGKEVEMAAQDNLTIGAWETLRTRAVSSAQVQSGPDASSPSQASTDGSAPRLDNPFEAGGTTSSTSSSSADSEPPNRRRPTETSPFDDISNGHPNSQDTPNSPRKPNTTNPFENL